MRCRGHGNCSRGSSRCRRGPYHRVRAVAQFLLPLLRAAAFSTSFLPADGRLERLVNALEGAPPSLMHEGPLTCCHVGAFATLQEGELLRALRGKVSDVLAPPPLSPHVAAMWPLSLQERYVQETARTRAEEMNILSPARFEAGLTAHRVFGGVARRTSFESLEQASVRVNEEEEDLRASRWHQLIDNYTLMLPDRSPLHELENLPQEIGIGELLSSLLPLLGDGETRIRTIIDVGGGNGILAAQLAEVFHCESIVVDPFTPRHAIDNDDFPHWCGADSARRRRRVARCYPLRRIRQKLTDVDWRATPLDVNGCALVAKHLCGTAIDSCLRHLHAVGKLPPVMVMVPCCFGKGLYADYCNPAYLHSVASVGTELAWNHWARLTDWNRSCHQQHSASWCNMRKCDDSTRGKDHRKKTMQSVLPCMDDVAFLVETVINHGRVLWLRELGYHTITLSYVPRCVTPKNRAIVAIRNTSLK